MKLGIHIVTVDGVFPGQQGRLGLREQGDGTQDEHPGDESDQGWHDNLQATPRQFFIGIQRYILDGISARATP